MGGVGDAMRLVRAKVVADMGGSGSPVITLGMRWEEEQKKKEKKKKKNIEMNN